MTATDHDCPDADYWRAEALTARSEAGVWRDAAVLTRGALAPVAAGILPRPLATGLLAYDEAPDPPRGAELLMSLAVAGPWIACTTGWALVVAAGQGAAAVARWVRP